MKKSFQFFVKRFLTNFLAAFLVCLSVADGEEAEHDIIHEDFQVAEILYDYVDFPTSLVRNNTVNYSNLQRIADDNSSKFEFGIIARKLFSDSKLKKITQIHSHPHITHLVKMVICKNAP
ncbi:hypothetical protein [Lunatibacter salilacus]|uniref:hypothetical protein n=1 Tax=Lunatibacter salilacus TaxID=2483804 RepID=UPI00131AD31C|nr:hypothetical protein [Lunatibacter salilacus]